jgi:hypothetical protein
MLRVYAALRSFATYVKPNCTTTGGSLPSGNRARRIGIGKR